MGAEEGTLFSPLGEYLGSSSSTCMAGLCKFSSKGSHDPFWPPVTPHVLGVLGHGGKIFRHVERKSSKLDHAERQNLIA